jgi:hypothetical protein
MMANDIRIATSWLTHPKRKKLEKRLGPKACLCFIDLLLETGQNKPSGRLDSWNAEDIAIAAQWDGDSGVFVSALVDLRLLDHDDNTYVIHDWRDHNPYAFGSEERSEKARKAANKMWEKRKEGEGKGDATSKNEQCSEHDLAERLAESSYAPSPSPSPSPNTKKPTSEVSTENSATTPLSDTERPVSDVAFALAEVLREEINKRSPNGKPLIKPTTSMRSWAVHFQRMINLDNRSPPEIEAVLRWSQTDPFWRNNILSPAKLREKWPQLVLKMNDRSGKTESIDDWAKRKEAELEAGGVQGVH